MAKEICVSDVRTVIGEIWIPVIDSLLRDIMCHQICDNEI